MPKNATSSRLPGILVLTLTALIAGCGPAPAKVGIAGGGGFGGGSKIQKGTEPTPALTENEQLTLALGELQWMNQGAANLLKAGAVTHREGCVTYRATQKVSPFLMTDYNCIRMSDASDSKADRSFKLSGTLSHMKTLARLWLDGTLQATITDTKSNAVVGFSQVARAVGITLPADTTAEPVYPLTATATSIADVAAESSRFGEEWTYEFKGAVDAAQAPATLKANSAFQFVYKPETTATKDGSRRTQTMVLVATTDISFVKNGSCLRPVGSFAWTIGTGTDARKGTLVATSAGFTRSDETGVSHAWGLRCLER